MKTLLISDFSIESLGRAFDADRSEPRIQWEVAPFGNVFGTLLASGMAQGEKIECAVIWTRPEAQIASFAKLVEFGEASTASVLEETDQFAEALVRFATRCRVVFVPCWTTPSWVRGKGFVDLTDGTGVAHMLSRMNLRLAERLRAVPNLFLLNAQKWMERFGEGSYDPRLWFMAKVPFSAAVLREATLELKAAWNGLHGRAKKLLILDLDDTLWGGAVGEIGWQGLRLGGHDPLGEAFQEFQRCLRALKERGVMLGIVSKNETTVALEAIERHPEMILRLRDFAGWRINWDDKAKNIVELVKELNISLDAAVFIDENPRERSRVLQSVVGVLVPEWPENPLFFPRALSALRCFDVPSVTDEDRQRTLMYVADRERLAVKEAVASLDEWLLTLGLSVRIQTLNKGDLKRACQLLNRTNQMNLTVRRLTEEELMAWAMRPGNAFWTVRVSDRFGDSGLVGGFGIQCDSDVALISDFVLSCRVIGRGVEQAMLYRIILEARQRNAKEVLAKYIRTSKNKPCLDLFGKSGFRCSDSQFSWSASHDYAFPSWIRDDSESLGC